CAVLTDERVNLAPSDFKVDVVVGQHQWEALGDAFHAHRARRLVGSSRAPSWLTSWLAKRLTRLLIGLGVGHCADYTGFRRRGRPTLRTADYPPTCLALLR